jgi:ssDNA-binding Zn-finger/Zn-ribbon topoisomerase 1
LSKKPRFYCDNCGYEVGSDVKSCPYCGRFFASVRCPKCDYSGPDKMFLNGCPMCGYSAPPPSPSKGKNPKVKTVRPKTHRDSEPLPAWALIASIVVLLAVIAFFSYLITR